MPTHYLNDGHLPMVGFKEKQLIAKFLSWKKKIKEVNKCRLFFTWTRDFLSPLKIFYNWWADEATMYFEGSNMVFFTCKPSVHSNMIKTTVSEKLYSFSFCSQFEV